MRSEALSVDGVAWRIDVVRHPTARRVTLRLVDWEPAVRLTLPRRAPLRPALAWARGQGPAVRRLAAARPIARPFRDGAALPLEGREVAIRHDPAARGVALDDPVRVGGRVDELSHRLHRALKAEARRRLTAETLAMAERHGLAVTSVGIGDPSGRWGSCSAAGGVRYSWRLILMPASVRRAIVAHELAHRTHLDHSPAFHREAERLLGGPHGPARAWLRAHGRALHGVGREASTG